MIALADDGAVVWRGPEQLRSLLVPIDSLTPDPANANTHPEKNLRTIRGSLAQYGQQKPIVVSPSGVVAAGNGTWQVLNQPVPAAGPGGELAASRWTHVAAIVSDLSPSQLVGYGIVDNRSNELAEWDLDALASHLGGLDADGVDLADLGFDEFDMSRLLGEAEPPEGFAEVDDDIETQYECPKCGYEWSGAPA